MARVLGFREDEAGHWAVLLSCGHSQHVRHQPPWLQRPWTQDPVQRQARLGSAFACGWCARGVAAPIPEPPVAT